MQFRPVVSAFLKNCTQKHVITCKSYAILLIKISTARGEAVLFLPACYFENNHTLPLGVLYCIRNSRMINIYIKTLFVDIPVYIFIKMIELM